MLSGCRLKLNLELLLWWLAPATPWTENLTVNKKDPAVPGCSQWDLLCCGAFLLSLSSISVA